MKRGMAKTCRPSAWLIFACFIGACGCKESGKSNGPESATDTEAPSDSESPSEQAVGPDGGVVESADGQASVIVPGGALAQSTTISVEQAEAPPPGASGPVYELEPSGLTFDEPVLLSLPYDESVTGEPIYAMTVATWQDEEWNPIELTMISMDGPKLMAWIDHFSFYAAYKVKCARNADCQEPMKCLDEGFCGIPCKPSGGGCKEPLVCVPCNEGGGVCVHQFCRLSNAGNMVDCYQGQCEGPGTSFSLGKCHADPCPWGCVKPLACRGELGWCDFARCDSDQDCPSETACVRHCCVPLDYGCDCEESGCPCTNGEPPPTSHSSAACGNGELEPDAGEICDDGAESATCDTDCTLAECGDQVVNGAADEQCDSGGESASCDTDCTVAQCGDGILNVTAGESCDEKGATASCDADCTLVECGDGVVNAAAGEKCDGTNLAGATCKSVAGLDFGSLDCIDCKLDTSGCGAECAAHSDCGAGDGCYGGLCCNCYEQFGVNWPCSPGDLCLGTDESCNHWTKGCAEPTCICVERGNGCTVWLNQGGECDTEEVCDDFLDNDCNGSVNDGCGNVKPNVLICPGRGTTPCTLSSGIAACDACVRTKCAVSCSDCQAEPECVSLLACALMCTPGDTVCATTCTAQFPGGVTPAMPAYNCMLARCATECGQ